MMFQKHDDNHDLIVSVARLLGEDVEHIQQRGFHILDIELVDDEPDAVDLAALTGGLDWDDVERFRKLLAELIARRILAKRRHPPAPGNEGQP